MQAQFIDDTWKINFQYFDRGHRTTSPAPFRFVPKEPALSKFPRAEDYYLVTLTVWSPDISFGHLLPTGMPCGVKQKCEAKCKSIGRSKHNGYTHARHIQGVDRYELLLQNRYRCPEHGDFASASDVALENLPAAVRGAFPYVLTEKSGLTKQ